MKIITNNQPRSILDYADLATEYQCELDHVEDGDGFFIYKGGAYNLSDFMRCDLDGWDGVFNLTAFSGLLVRVDNSDDATVTVAYYYQ